VVDAANKMEELNKDFGTYIAVTRSVYAKARPREREGWREARAERERERQKRTQTHKMQARSAAPCPLRAVPCEHDVIRGLRTHVWEMEVAVWADAQANTQFLFRPLDKVKSRRRQREPEVVYELIGARERYGEAERRTRTALGEGGRFMRRDKEGEWPLVRRSDAIDLM
jgi:hypothetical protein